ncbi:MFS transporter [Algicella marina]|uniref:MFS transporter n=1 Tax=Algicella marina TaxID=2683284 RepID=A0A6P1SWM7_9RHOB|nr:MFS transporter [Algicella marina]QHQ35074.1 MFS transporter [Algicella marina]
MSRSDGGDRHVITVLSAGNFIIGMGAFVVIGILVPLSDDFAISHAAAGWMMTVYAMAYAVLSPVLIALTGELGRRRLLMFALALFAFGTLLSALAPTVTLLFASRILVAAGAGLFTPASAAVAALVSAPEQRGRALAQVVFGLTLAQVLGVPVGSFIAYALGWRASFLLVVVLALPCIWLIARIVPRGLQFQPTRLGTLGRALLDWRMMLAVSFTASFIGSINVFYTYFAAFLAKIQGYERNGVTLMLLIFGVGAVLGNLAGGWMADRLGPVRTLAMLTLSQVVLMPLYSYPMVVGGGISFALLATLTFIWSVFGWSFMAAQQLRLLARAPEAQTVVLALNAAAIYVGFAMGAAYGGAVIEAYGLGPLGISAGLFAALALVHLFAGESAAKER